MEHFGLSLEKEKSRLIEFGRFAEKNRKQRGEGKPEMFNFLGFTHYCSQSKNGRFRVKRKTSRKKYQKKLKELNAEICEMAVIAGMRVQDIIKKLNQILTGYSHYYGITDNIKMLDNFLFRVRRSLFKWLNRRSQKKSFTWEAFRSLLKDYPLVSPRIYVSIYGD